MAKLNGRSCVFFPQNFQIQKKMLSDFTQSIFCNAQYPPVMLSTVGTTFKTPHLASGSQIIAFIWSTAWDLSRKELIPVYQRKWVTGKSWHSTNYSWGTRWLVYSQSQWSGFVLWWFWFRCCDVSSSELWYYKKNSLFFNLFLFFLTKIKLYYF